MVQKDSHEHEVIIIQTDHTKISFGKWGKDGLGNDIKCVNWHDISDEFNKSLQHDGENIVIAMMKIAKGLKRRKDVHCPNCGGLVPELGILFDGKFYKFVCHEVQEEKTEKVLRETDYAKLHEYTRPEKRQTRASRKKA